MVLSGLTIILWWLEYHLQEKYCKAISPALTIILAWECSWFDFATLTYGEAMQPTFSDRAQAGDIKMPADDYCLYHCFSYARSNSTAPLNEDYAKRLQKRVAARIRRESLLTQAARLLKLGAAGYPNEKDFAYLAAEAGFSFAIVQASMPAPLVYGSELGPIGITVRRHFIADGERHLSPRYDVISYEAPLIMAYEELTATKLDGYKAFLCWAISAEPTIGNTELTNMLEEKHGVSAKNGTMKWWRGRNKRLLASMARQSLLDACDAYDALIASMGPSSEPPIEVDTIEDTDMTIPAPSELAVGVMDNDGAMANSAHGAIVGGAIAIDEAICNLTARGYRG